MSPIILAAAALALAAWLGFLSVAKASTILNWSLANAVIACLISLYLPSEPARMSEVSQLLAILAAALVGLGLTAYWLLHSLPDILQDETRGR